MKSRVLAEFFGSAVLVCVVVGSGIMGTSLSNDLGVALLINAFSTIFALAILIEILGPISGAHFNPLVSWMQYFRREQSLIEVAWYIAAQVGGACAGAVVANMMFDSTAFQISAHDRVSAGHLLGEVIASAGLILVIRVLQSRRQSSLIPVAVAGWIGSAYFFTSSTSFANPAVTIGRIFSDSFAGIAPTAVPLFIAAQCVGLGTGLALAALVDRGERSAQPQQVID